MWRTADEQDNREMKEQAKNGKQKVQAEKKKQIEVQKVQNNQREPEGLDLSGWRE